MEDTIKSKTTFALLLHFLLASVTIAALSGCEKVINIDLNEAAPHIVIEGLVTDGPGPYAITISKSGSYFNQPVLPPVSGAIVIITDNTGIIDSVKESTPGIYLTSITLGIPGLTYTLKVISEGQEYDGTSTIHSHVKIDSLTLVKNTSSGFGPDEDTQKRSNIEIHCFFKDPPEKNFYRIRAIKNDSINTQNYRLYDDQYTNGEEIELRVANASAGDTFKIELMSLDQATYGYYRTLSDLLHTNPIFGSTPANPNTNLSNGALGYFGACAVSFNTIIVTQAMIDAVK
ncbi:MAG: DUF4249 domain-containing protein [Bacteroidales bacterium]|jgi:hypothetical protein